MACRRPWQVAGRIVGWARARRVLAVTLDNVAMLWLFAVLGALDAREAGLRG